MRFMAVCGELCPPQGENREIAENEVFCLKWTVFIRIGNRVSTSTKKGKAKNGIT
jgi:hypothetical protein